MAKPTDLPICGPLLDCNDPSFATWINRHVKDLIYHACAPTGGLVGAWKNSTYKGTLWCIKVHSQSDPDKWGYFCCSNLETIVDPIELINRTPLVSHPLASLA